MVAIANREVVDFILSQRRSNLPVGLACRWVWFEGTLQGLYQVFIILSRSGIAMEKEGFVGETCQGIIDVKAP